MNSGDIFNLNADAVPDAHGQQESSSPVGRWFDPVLWKSKDTFDRFTLLNIGSQTFAHSWIEKD
jgi:hypothetical protein